MSDFIVAVKNHVRGFVSMHVCRRACSLTHSLTWTLSVWFFVTIYLSVQSQSCRSAFNSH